MNTIYVIHVPTTAPVRFCNFGSYPRSSCLLWDNFGFLWQTMPEILDGAVNASLINVL